ncbi:MAG: AAA family ATPase [Actinobacteria bacterium]|nr:AAA family ATPase [Actinomycetota bacterium]
MIMELRAPRTVEELHVPSSLLQDLTLRRILFEGKSSTVRLSEGLCLSLQATTEIVEEMRELRYVEILGLDGRDYQLALTDLGRESANERMTLCRYAGAVPVSLYDYVSTTQQQTASPTIDRELMRDAFSDLVVNDDLLDELGPALISDGAVFLYGPPGTGKSSVAERLIRVHQDNVLVPKAVEVDTQIITVYDPIAHIAIEPQPPDLDPRWVLCRRPAIISGGELQLEMLDLTYETSNGVYIAPLQMQANNGIFVIDDFGRQTVSPEALLNRWIVPLDRRRDYLSLSYGLKFEIPFDVKVVFSTNLEPAALGDEAFFRRIQNKILVRPISDEEFDAVLIRAASSYGVTIESGAATYLRRVSREVGDGDLRPYLPLQVCKILHSVCEYKSMPLILDRANIDRIASIYFTRAAHMKSSMSSIVSTQQQPPAPPPQTPPPVTPEPATQQTPGWNTARTLDLLRDTD